MSIDGFSSALEALGQWLFLNSSFILGWTQIGYNGKNKSVKQYAMTVIACRKQKYRKQNWWPPQLSFWTKCRFSHVFFHIFQGPSHISGSFRDLFRGINRFRAFSGFSGVSGVAGHAEKSIFTINMHWAIWMHSKNIYRTDSLKSMSLWEWFWTKNKTVLLMKKGLSFSPGLFLMYF